MAGPLLEAQALGKLFGLVPVLSGVQLSLGPGQGALIVGRNGAGKSTLVRTLAGLSRPNSGRAFILGEQSHRLSAARRRRVGILTHQSLLYPNLTARENLEFYSELYGVPNPASIAGEWLERVGLPAAADRRVRALSRGMEQRVAVARAMIADPEVMLLDEPFAALDSEGTALVAALIKDALLRGRAVLITAHAPLEIDGLQFEMRELVKGRLIPLREEARRGRLRSLLGP